MPFLKDICVFMLLVFIFAFAEAFLLYFFALAFAFSEVLVVNIVLLDPMLIRNIRGRTLVLVALAYF